MSITLHQIDAFTGEAFRGNPAAVCLTDSPLTETSMSLIAREMNLSETAFLVPRGERFHLRWFTPKTEVDLCGHATLASAHFLWETGVLETEKPALFETLSGLLEARRSGRRIVMDFPQEPATISDVPSELLEAIREPIVEAGRNRLDYLVVLATEDQVRSLKPELDRIARLSSRGVIVTATASSGSYDFVSRYFAPQYGIPEDPVTGSAHCCLAPYWCNKRGENRLIGYQASQRGGIVEVSLAGDRVMLGGEAVTIARMELLADV